MPLEGLGWRGYPCLPWPQQLLSSQGSEDQKGVTLQHPPRYASEAAPPSPHSQTLACMHSPEAPSLRDLRRGQGSRNTPTRTEALRTYSSHGGKGGSKGLRSAVAGDNLSWLAHPARRPSGLAPTAPLLRSERLPQAAWDLSWANVTAPTQGMRVCSLGKRAGRGHTL